MPQHYQSIQTVHPGFYSDMTRSHTTNSQSSSPNRFVTAPANTNVPSTLAASPLRQQDKFPPAVHAVPQQMQYQPSSSTQELYFISRTDAFAQPLSSRRMTAPSTDANVSHQKSHNDGNQSAFHMQQEYIASMSNLAYPQNSIPPQYPSSFVSEVVMGGQASPHASSNHNSNNNGMSCMMAMDYNYYNL